MGGVWCADVDAVTARGWSALSYAAACASYPRSYIGDSDTTPEAILKVNLCTHRIADTPPRSYCRTWFLCRNQDQSEIYIDMGTCTCTVARAGVNSFIRSNKQGSLHPKATVECDLTKVTPRPPPWYCARHSRRPNTSYENANATHDLTVIT
jgi:hypothetical protein